MSKVAFLTLVLISAAFAQTSSKSPTPAEARKFIEQVEDTLLKLANEAGRAQWVQANFITQDTEAIAALANERANSTNVRLAKEAARFNQVNVPADVRRKLELLKVSLTLPAPANPAESTELSNLAAALEGAYGRAKYCPPGKPEDQCLADTEIIKIMATSRDPKQLLDVWRGWHSIAPPLKKDFSRVVELSNKGSRELGFKDTGALWRAGYDMPPDDFARELDRLWEQVKPLYVALHTYVRGRLHEKYGAAVPEKGPIPAHLLGNIWSQTWENIYDIVAPPGSDIGYDLTKILRERKTDEKQMVRYGEQFFTSLGFDPLPQTFWQRSLFVKPRDRDVVCHASAWDVDNVNDLRIKMCIDITAEDFATIHHELGHNFYQRAYNKQPFLFRTGANDGFHEAIGDTIALSVTPEYLVKLGMLDKAPDSSRDVGLLMQRALEKISFLPFGLLIDQWRWKVFSGEVTPANYNKAWWDLRLKYQGVAPAEMRGEDYFDPAAKYHVAANVPYTRYFLAAILQFQFHRALARAAGCTGPLHRCSIYGSKEAGAKLAQMLEMGASKPWQEALFAVTGERQMDASAMREYFAPLEKWLNEQNRGKVSGW
jgi:peptidyl-dipeptidase A